MMKTRERQAEQTANSLRSEGGAKVQVKSNVFKKTCPLTNWKLHTKHSGCEAGRAIGAHSIRPDEVFS